ncbi:MAG: radical SAM protein [Candidatus Omnitrophica bacterium]|nr:radical SAM protein [Candidatus Omnitrophota bacterium]
MKEKIILATVNAKRDLYSITSDEFSAIAPNIQMGLLAEYIKSQGIDVVMVESDVDGISYDGLIDIAVKENPVALGIICSGANPSSSTMVMAGVVDFFARFHERGIKIKNFIWGAHPTVLPERTLRETGADFVVRGEGYSTITDLTHFLSGASHKRLGSISGLSYLSDSDDPKHSVYCSTQDAVLVSDLDALPPIDWEIMPPKRYRAHNWHAFGDLENRSPYAIIWTSFGCPFKCNFCSINNLFGKRVQRFRSMKNVVAEIDILVNKYGVRHLKILDELFVVNPRRMEEFCDLLDERKYNLNMWAYSRVDTISRYLLKRLKKVGMNWISYGFESATEQILQVAEKGCRNLNVDDVIRMTKDEGVSICADVMFGLWDEDMDSVKRTFDFLVKYNFEWVNMYPVFAYPGTVLFDRVAEMPDWKAYALYGYDCRPMSTKFLSSAEVLRFRDEAFGRYHSRPEYLAMIEQRFGKSTREHIMRMTAKPLRRRILGH